MRHWTWVCHTIDVTPYFLPLIMIRRASRTTDVETLSEFRDMVKLLEDSHEWKAELTVELEKIKKATNVTESDNESDGDTGQEGSYGVHIQ